MAVIDGKKDETVAVVRMVNGENRFNPVFVQEFLQTLNEIEQEKSLSSVVLFTEDAKNWSLGIELIWMQGRPGRERTSRASRNLFTV